MLKTLFSFHSGWKPVVGLPGAEIQSQGQTYLLSQGASISSRSFTDFARSNPPYWTGLVVSGLDSDRPVSSTRCVLELFLPVWPTGSVDYNVGPLERHFNLKLKLLKRPAQRNSD